MVMSKLGKNKKKKFCLLQYQTLIWDLYNQKKGEKKNIREITTEIAELLNRRYVSKTRFKGITISKSGVYKIIKKRKEYIESHTNNYSGN